ncbi:hypothetical protein B0H10DRAFT_1824052 [Mycena sp. CBHHK59/15]|nr:hypothetical protein B0H10DRAFT_1824052 [Mycena sp. CBHHK59/15]
MCTRPGKGALARWGDYWYPVRLIQKKDQSSWVVKWWRLSHFPSSGPSPELWTTIEEKDLQDELWADVAARRQIKLGRWTHACETPTEEDVLYNFLDSPYTTELDDILRPHMHVLSDLLSDFESPGKHDDIPAAIFARKARSSPQRASEALRNGGIPFTGGLDLVDCARVSNWFYSVIPGAKSHVVLWLGRVPLAHAYTLVIAARNRKEIIRRLKDGRMKEGKSGQARHIEADILEAAWEYQMTRPLSVLRAVDVDRECLGAFEERLFEDSAAAGRAGNRQWGLDAGEHQDDWNPYCDLPAHWNHGDRHESDTELLVGWPHRREIQALANVEQPGPLFAGSDNFTTEAAVMPHAGERPRPRPLRKGP